MRNCIKTERWEIHQNAVTKKAVYDENNREQKINLEEQGTLTWRSAQNALAQAYAKESNTTLQRALKIEVWQEERTGKNSNPHEAITKEIPLEEMKLAIKQLKKKKSWFPVNITNTIFQYLGNKALQKLLDIFSVSWSQGQGPQCWKEAIVIPVLKKGTKAKATDPSAW